MNWDQQALETWLEESARQDEDAMTIAKYARADEGKIRVKKNPQFFVRVNSLLNTHQELNLRMERLHEQMTKKKRQLDNEMIEGTAAQIEMDKTAESFRSAHQEREDIINQWEHTINQMKKRDEDMEKCAKVFL